LVTTEPIKENSSLASAPSASPVTVPTADPAAADAKVDPAADAKKTPATAAPAPAAPIAEPVGVFKPLKNETPAEALRRRLQESKKQQVKIEEDAVKATGKQNPDDDDFAHDDDYHMPIADEDLEIVVEDHFRPNIFFQNARYSGFAPTPEGMPRHHQLPTFIYFFIRVSDVAPVPLTKPLPDNVKDLIQLAKTVRGQESAGPLARIDFNEQTVLGIAGRLDSIIAGFSQLVIEVPSVEAYPLQDPRVEPTSLPFQPYHQSSLHGEWLPRVNVAIRTDKPRATEDGQVRLRPLKLKHVRADLYEDGAPSPTQIGNPYATPSQRSSRATLASERRLSASARRLSVIGLESAAMVAAAAVNLHKQKGCSVASDLSTVKGAAVLDAAAGTKQQAGVRQASGKNLSVLARQDTISSVKSANTTVSTPAQASAVKTASLATSPQSMVAAETPTSGTRWPRWPCIRSTSTITASSMKTSGCGPPASPEERWVSSRHSTNTTTPRTPGSSRSLRSAGGHPAGITGGPPNRDLWPRDFAADLSRESDLEQLRIQAKKDREERILKEREIERQRRAQERRGR